MNPTFDFTVTDADLRRFESLYARYRQLHDDPARSSPMFIVNTPIADPPTWEQRLADPAVMLRASLNELKPHLAIADDHVPTVRVEFGTPQVAAAFGCDVVVPANNLPAAGSHVMRSAREVYRMARPPLRAGGYARLEQWTELWLKWLPPGIHIQHPDIQSAFNTAHLVRGNDILTDFYDDPAAVDALLDLVTDTMIELTPWLNQMIGAAADGWFFDWGAMWKGRARISNCSMHMISPAFYRDHVLPRDARFFAAIGGGRMHYCGSYPQVIRDFFSVPHLTGLDYDSQYHDLYALCQAAPRHAVLLQHVPEDSELGQRLLSGDWPAKRNLVITTSAASVEAGQDLLRRFRESVPD